MIKSKKKVLGVFKVSFLRNLVGAGHSLLKFIQGGLMKKKSVGNPGLRGVKKEKYTFESQVYFSYENEEF